MKGPLRHENHKRPLTRRDFLRANGATAFSGGVYACAVEPYWLETVRTEIKKRTGSGSRSRK